MLLEVAQCRLSLRPAVTARVVGDDVELAVVEEAGKLADVGVVSRGGEAVHEYDRGARRRRLPRARQEAQAVGGREARRLHGRKATETTRRRSR